MRRACFLVIVFACRSAATPPLNKAGDDRDDGAGMLARASVQLVIGPDQAEHLDDTQHRRHGTGEYGGESYASWTPPSWNAPPAAHAPRYAVTTKGLDGSIVGVVTWAGAMPRVLPCSAGSQVGADRTIHGALVYIEDVTAGRGFPAYAGPAQVGGTIVKHGCTLGPIAQVVAPVPTTLAIHGDAQLAHLRVTKPGAADPVALELAAGSVVTIALDAGVTKIDGDATAWVVGVETPYVAITDDAGRFRIDELVPGIYDVTIFAAPFAAGKPPIIVHRTVKVGHAAASLPIALH